MINDKTIFELQAEVCKTLASPIRLQIIHVLKNGEKTVSQLVDELETPKANVSQHLAVMRNQGVLQTRKSGTNVFYAIANAKVVQACTLMKEVLTERMREDGKLLMKMAK